MKTTICHNALIATACICCAAVGIASIVTGHDGLEIVLGTIAGLSGVAAPVAGKFMASQQVATDNAGSPPAVPQG